MSIEILERLTYTGAGVRTNVAGGGGGGGGSTLPQLATLWSEEWMNRLGINAHTTYTGYMDALAGTYSSPTAMWLDKMAYLGARNIRDKIKPDSRPRTIFAALYSSLGVHVCFCGGQAAQSPMTAAAFASEIKNYYPAGAVTEVTGYNEPDSGSPAGWAAGAITYQQALWSAFAGTGIQVLAGVLAFSKNAPALGNLSAYCHGTDCHPYPGGSKPCSSGATIPTLSGYLDESSATAPGKPVYVTECGYNNGMATAGQNKPCPEDVSGVYVPIEHAEAIRLGVKKTFFYEMTNGLRNDALDDQQKQFGMCAWDAQTVPSFRNKPAAVALHNTTQLCLDPGAPPVLTNLRGTISDPAVHYLPFGKRDGSYLLFLWRDVSIWNPSTSVIYTPPLYTAGRLTVNSTNCTVDFGTSKSVQVYKPSSGPAQVGSTVVATSVVVSLAAELVILKIA